MATIIKRNGSFRVQIRRKGEKSISGTFYTKTQAEIWAYQMEAMILAGEKPEQSIAINNALSVVDIFEKYKKTVSPLKRGFRWEKIRIESLCKDSTFLIPIEKLTNKVMASWRDKRLSQVQSSTVNRELNLISAIITKAIKEWGIELPNNPVFMIQRPKNPKPRDKRVSQEEKELIAKQLKWDMESEPQTASQWTAFAFFLAIETAMRRGELASFRWCDLHLEESYIHLEMTKNGEQRDVPLSSKAKALLYLLTPKSDKDHVIPPAPDVITSLFRKAKLDVGLKNLRFHDARREATTQFAEKFSNPLELSAVTGHKSLEILRRVYYKPKPSDLAKKLD